MIDYGGEEHRQPVPEGIYDRSKTRTNRGEAKALVAYGTGVTITDEITASADSNGELRRWPLEPTLSFNISTLRFDNMPLSRVAQKFVEHLKRTVEAYIDDSPQA